MITDNFDQISRLLKFDTKDDFYFMQIIQRKKDGCDTRDSGNNGYRTIKSYYIRSVDDLMRRKDKIVELCKSNNARAYINLNRRNARQVALAAAKAYIDLVNEDRCDQGFKIYDHVCGVTRNSKAPRYWIVDVDTKDPVELHEAIVSVDSCRSGNPRCLFGGYDNVRAVIPTPNGNHLIATGFDARELNGKFDIKKDNPTILYYAGLD